MSVPKPLSGFLDRGSGPSNTQAESPWRFCARKYAIRSSPLLESR